MMYPILCKVRYESLIDILKHPGLWKQIIFSIIVNWIVAPFLMVSRSGTTSGFEVKATHGADCPFSSLPWPGLFSRTRQTSAQA